MCISAIGKPEMMGRRRQRVRPKTEQRWELADVLASLEQVFKAAVITAAGVRRAARSSAIGRAYRVLRIPLPFNEMPSD